MKVIGKYGLVCDIKPGYAKVNFDEDGIVSDWLPVLARKSKTDKENWQFEVDEQVFCIMFDDNGSHCDDGVILGATCNDQDQPDEGQAAGKFRLLFEDGTLIEYDKKAHKLTLDVKGDLSATVTQNAEIRAAKISGEATVSVTMQAPVINLTGNVIVSGSLSAASIATTGGGAITSEGNISTTGNIIGNDIVAGGVSLKSHKHSGVQTGSGVTGPAI